LTAGRKSDDGAVVRLSADNQDGRPMVAGQVVLMIADEPVKIEFLVPQGLVATEELLPIFQGLTELFVGRSRARAEAEGKMVSCRAGCGACCRQLVPVSETEARALARLVAAMPEPRRTQVRQRFDSALATLSAAGLLTQIERAGQGADVTTRELGLAYFYKGIACPFLDDESCSIHPDRPLACREYLVTSPAQNCATPSAATIEMVRPEARPSLALLKASEAYKGWLPLTSALEFAARVPSSLPSRGAAEILREVLDEL
jgi:Fe-S-cluster containining protein